MIIIPSTNPGNAYTVPATFTGSGQYSVSIPTQPSPVQDIENVCEDIAEVLFFDSVTTTIQGDANVTLTVPGGAEGVVDTITVTVRNGPTRRIVLVF